jgi:hypothetical protein
MKFLLLAILVPFLCMAMTPTLDMRETKYVKTFFIDTVRIIVQYDKEEGLIKAPLVEANGWCEVKRVVIPDRDLITYDIEVFIDIESNCNIGIKNPYSEEMIAEINNRIIELY